MKLFYKSLLWIGWIGLLSSSVWMISDITNYDPLKAVGVSFFIMSVGYFLKEGYAHDSNVKSKN